MTVARSRCVRVGPRFELPHVVPMLDAGRPSDGVSSLAMPIVVGETLHAGLARPAARRGRRTRHRGTAGALAHAPGVIRPDEQPPNVQPPNVQPPNVLLDATGDAHVAAFGIIDAFNAGEPDARLTLSGVVVGSRAPSRPSAAPGAP